MTEERYFIEGPPTHFRVKVKGLPGFWAKRVRGGYTRVYIRVSKDGEETEVPHYVVVHPDDLIVEMPAKVNLKYGELEVLS